MTNDNWPFDQSRDYATFTLREIMSGEKPILRVTHDEDDHGWQFLDGGIPSMKDAMIVALEEVVEKDSSVFEVADLQPGWIATRQSVSSPWRRESSSANSDRE